MVRNHIKLGVLLGGLQVGVLAAVARSAVLIFALDSICQILEPSLQGLISSYE